LRLIKDFSLIAIKEIARIRPELLVGTLLKSSADLMIVWISDSIQITIQANFSQLEDSYE
jgi:hypothetical protein